MPKLIGEIRKHIRHHELVVGAFILAIAVALFPLQHYMTLSRFQHYGLALGVWAFGFFVQMVVSWRRMGFFGHAYLGVASIYLAMFAHVIYTNPWLDPKVTLETTTQASSRHDLASLFIGLGMVLMCIYFGWTLEEARKDK